MLTVYITRLSLNQSLEYMHNFDSQSVNHLKVCKEGVLHIFYTPEIISTFLSSFPTFDLK
jgi:hypothetical protein